ncbi:hypothetical protein GZH46_00896, partial [Fragariocoptes setiger]
MANLGALDKFFEDKTFISGQRLSAVDLAFVSSLQYLYSKNVVDSKEIAKYRHFNRYYNTIVAQDEFKNASDLAMFKSGPAAKAGDACCMRPKAAAPVQPADDDELDLFDSGDDEEAEKARADRVKAYQEKKAAKPAVIAKSSVIIDVKPWDDTTDLKEIEKHVRSITKDGLVWGASKTVPLAFGVSKLQIVAVIEDAKVSVDDITEQIEEYELVQSTDIAAFQKI